MKSTSYVGQVKSLEPWGLSSVRPLLRAPPGFGRGGSQMTLTQMELLAKLRRRRKLGRLRQERYRFLHPERVAESQRKYHAKRSDVSFLTPGLTDAEASGLSLRLERGD